jgi:hypothetical protein
MLKNLLQHDFLLLPFWLRSLKNFWGEQITNWFYQSLYHSQSFLSTSQAEVDSHPIGTNYS